MIEGCRKHFNHFPTKRVRFRCRNRLFTLSVIQKSTNRGDIKRQCFGIGMRQTSRKIVNLCVCAAVILKCKRFYLVFRFRRCGEGYNNKTTITAAVEKKIKKKINQVRLSVVASELLCVYGG